MRVTFLGLGDIGSLMASHLVRDPFALTVWNRTEQKARDAYGKLPLAFVPNEGQADARVRYSGQVGGASFYFTQNAAVFSFAKSKQKGAVLSLGFLGANPTPVIEGRQLAPGRVNYLLGNDPAKWHTNLPTYGQVVYRDLWPGIDMRFHGTGSRLKYEFVLRPGARVADINLAYRGARDLSVSRAGALAIGTPLGALRDERPRTYQLLKGMRVSVESRYTLHGGTSYGFAVARDYDHAQPLVIDPGLVYSTFLGGSGNDALAGEAAPDELSTIANVMPAPPMPFVPEEHHGKLVVLVVVRSAAVNTNPDDALFDPDALKRGRPVEGEIEASGAWVYRRFVPVVHSGAVSGAIAVIRS